MRTELKQAGTQQSANAVQYTTDAENARTEQRQQGAERGADMQAGRQNATHLKGTQSNHEYT